MILAEIHYRTWTPCSQGCTIQFMESSMISQHVIPIWWKYVHLDWSEDKSYRVLVGHCSLPPGFLLSCSWELAVDGDAHLKKTSDQNNHFTSPKKGVSVSLQRTALRMPWAKGGGIGRNKNQQHVNEHIGRIDLHFVSQVSWPVGSWNRSIHSMWWDYVGLEWQSRDPMARLLNRWMLNLVEMIRSCSSLMYLEDNVSLMSNERTSWCFLDQNGHLML